MRQKTILLISAFIMLIMACTNPFSFGPGRFDLTLEDVRVEAISQATLFPRNDFGQTPDRDRETIIVRFSSTLDLFDYFSSWQRQIHVTCYLEGAANGRGYNSIGHGLYERGVDISRLRRGDTGPRPAGENGRHLYTTYTFIDLVADEDVYENGSPRSELHLDKDRWSRIGCYVIGVTKAPVLFPRSNDLYVSAEQFRSLVVASKPQ